jgi:hypothetical protein
MKEIFNKYKSISKPMQIFFGIMIVFAIIVLAKGGYLIGVWLKTII